MRHLGFALLLAVLWAAPAWASAVGEWVTEGGKARVKMAPCAADEGQLCGTITWAERPPDAPAGEMVDIHNTDPGLRTRPIVGQPLLQGFRSAGPDAWEGGTLYDPEGGKTYKSKFRLDGPDRLKVDGCILFICQTQTWTRWQG